MDTIDLLTHCALACAFKRVYYGDDYDRNREVYRYFSKYRFIAKGRDRSMAMLICKLPERSALIFDQYYGMIMGELANPDAYPTAQHLIDKYEEMR